MPNNTEKGNLGEEIALSHLKAKGYEILCQNWRFKHLELDIVASFNNFLVIVEVKMRANDEFGRPEEFVSKAKQKKLIKAAHYYIQENNVDLETRFDVISILEYPKLAIEHFEGAFYPTL